MHTPRSKNRLYPLFLAHLLNNLLTQPQIASIFCVWWPVVGSTKCTGCPRSNAPPPLSLRQDKEPQMFLGGSTQLFAGNQNFAFVSPNSDGIQPEFRFVEFLRKLIPEFRWNSIRIMEWKCQIRIHRKKLTISLLRAIWVTWCGAELIFPSVLVFSVWDCDISLFLCLHPEKPTLHHTK